MFIVMKTKSALILTTIFTASLLVDGPLLAQQPKPFELTHYEKRIPADAWMLFSMDMNVFLSSKEYLKVAMQNSNPIGGPPKELVDLMTSGKLNIIWPYPLLFGVGGDASKPGNSPENNPAVMDFLKNRHHFGMYFNLSAIPNDLVSTWYKSEGQDIKLTEAEVLELFGGLKKIIPPMHGGVDFAKGQFRMLGAVYDKDMAAKWPGDGIPKALLDVIPDSSFMVMGASLNIENANDDIQMRLAEIFKLVNAMQKIQAPEGQPAMDLDELGKQLNALAQDAVGMDAKDLLKIFKGDVVMAMGMEPGPPGPDGVAQPIPSIVVGLTVKDEGKVTNLMDAFKAQGLLNEEMVKVVRRPGLIFLCTPNLAADLEEGAAAKPLAGPALKALQDNHLSMYFDLQKVMALQELTGQDFFAGEDKEVQELIKQMDSMVLTGKFVEGKLATGFAFKFRDPKIDLLAAFAKIGARQNRAAAAIPAEPVDPIAALNAKAQLGDVEAMHQLGTNNWHGRGGLEKNERLGVTWFRKAAVANHRDSQYMMGVIHWLGRGAPKDMGQSYYWMSLAAAQGHQDAELWKPKASAQLTPAQRATIDQNVADKLKQDKTP
jgi:TPR repeat protein